MEPIEVLHLIESILEVQPDTLTLDSDLRILDWDSLADLSFMAAVDERLGTQLDPMMLAAAQTPADLVELVAGDS